MKIKKVGRNTLFIKISIIIALLLFLLSCNGQQSQADEDSAGGTPVKIVNPKLMDFTENVDLNANTVFLKKEIIRATFQGFIDKIYKNIGDVIHSGDLLVTIKTKESIAGESMNLKLGEELFHGSIKITAHSDGVLTTLNYNNGDFVSDGEEIAIISNPSSLRITLNVPYAYVSQISMNTDCKIFLPDGQVISAVIQKIIPSVDPASQTQTFLLLPKQSIDLPENLNVSARLPLKTVKNAVVLPREAVLSNETQEKFWIMKLINDSTALRTDVIKGLENDSLIQITSPVLSPTDRIISEGGFGLPDTASVTVSE